MIPNSLQKNGFILSGHRGICVFLFTDFILFDMDFYIRIMELVMSGLWDIFEQISGLISQLSGTSGIVSWMFGY